MKCSDKMYNLMGILSSFSIFVTLYAIYIQGYNIKSKKKKMMAIFPLLLSITLLLKLPTQICIALEHKEGWYSVIGISIKLCSLLYLAYLSSIY